MRREYSAGLDYVARDKLLSFLNKLGVKGNSRGLNIALQMLQMLTRDLYKA